MPDLATSAVMIFAGPIDDRSRCAQALIAAGFATMPEDAQQAAKTWGLPSYTDPITAHSAGKPNSGHHVDGLHPSYLDYLVLSGDHEEGCTLTPEGDALPCEHVGKTEVREHVCDHVGQPYEEDPAIGWMAVFGEGVNSAVPAVTSAGWALRLHTSPPSTQVLSEQPGGLRFGPRTDEELFAKLEARYAALRAN